MVVIIDVVIVVDEVGNILVCDVILMFDVGVYSEFLLVVIFIGLMIVVGFYCMNVFWVRVVVVYINMIGCGLM